MSSHDGERERDSCLFSYKGTNPITRALSSWPHPNLITSQRLTNPDFTLRVFSMWTFVVPKSWFTLCNPMDCSTPGFPVLYCLPEFAQTHVHWVGDAIQPSHLLLPSSPSAFSVSQHQGLFQWVGSCIRWPKYWRFSFSISPSSGYSGLISFRMDWLDLLAVRGTLKSLLQHHSPKASILQHLTFLIFQLSHLYMSTGKTIALTIWTFLGKMMPLPF